MQSTRYASRLAVTLALEGGGALGAFTWGVLERLLDTPQLQIASVSGASAGAMNGAMLVQGLSNGGPEAAKDLLQTFWQRVAIAAGSLPGPAGAWLHVVAGTLAPLLDAVRKAGSALPSPPPSRFTINPLRGILSELLHPPRFDAPGAPEFVVAATRVRTGEARLFTGPEITIDALLASACLPLLFSAIEIDGEAYWDGGYSSNPPVRPLIEAGAPPDVIIVRTLPAERLAMPSGATAVKDRLSEITFGTPLRAELHSIALAQAALAGVPHLPPALARLRHARLHMISPDADDAHAAAATSQPTWPLLAEQRRLGHAAAERWLAQNLQALGEHATFTLDQVKPDPGPTPPATSFLQGAANAT